MTQPEARLQRQIQDALRLEGYFVFKVHGSQYMMAGLPDLIVCAQGIYFGLEVKTPHERANVSTIQKYRHQQIREAGGFAHVVCSVAEAIDYIDSQLKDPKL